MSIVRQRKPFERKWARQVKAALRASWSSVLDMHDYSNVSVDVIERKVKIEPLYNVYRRLYRDVGVWFASQEQARFKRRGFTFQTKDEWTDIWGQTFEAYVVTSLDPVIKKATAYTADLIMNNLTDIMKEVRTEGLSISQATDLIQKELVKKMGTIERWRSMRIAQTEVLAASNKGGIEGVKSLGIPVKLYWRTGGNNIRDSHSQAQIDNAAGIDLNGMFLVGGQEAPYPGYEGLTAAERINCKCWVDKQAI